MAQLRPKMSDLTTQKQRPDKKRPKMSDLTTQKQRPDKKRPKMSDLTTQKQRPDKKRPKNSILCVALKIKSLLFINRQTVSEVCNKRRRN